MRGIQNIRFILVLIWSSMFSCYGLWAENAATNLTQTTFEYKESKSYAELTNSIFETEKRLTDTEKTLGNNNTNFAYMLNDLAGYYDDLGDYAQSATLDERSLGILKKRPEADAEEIADVVDDLAWEYRSMNDYDRAIPLFWRSIELTKKLYGPQDYRIATTLTGIADIYREEGDYSRALPLCEQGLEIRKTVLGPDHPDMTDSLYTLAAIYRELGNYKKALSLCQQSISIGERHLGPESPMVADNVFLLGQIESNLGNFSEASSALHRALAIGEKISGLDHPDVLEDLRELAVLYGKQREFGQSISTCIEMFKRQRRYLVGQILASSDRDALRLVQNSFESTEIFHSACADGSSENLAIANVAGATELALNKALLEEVRAAQAAFEADPRTATRGLSEQYRSVQYELEHLGDGDLTKSQAEARRGELQDQLSQIESKLYNRVGMAARTVDERNLTLIDIAHSLPLQSALVDFVQYRRYDFAANTNQWQEKRYAAYLTFPLMNGSTNVHVDRVDLGDAGPIDDAIGRLLLQFSAGHMQSPIAATNLSILSRLIYAPLGPPLTHVSHLIICPDGQLGRMPFEMLSVGTNLLVQKKTISYVTSGREVVRFAGHAAKVRNSGSVVVGDPDFNFDVAGAPPLNPAFQLAGGPSALRSARRGYHGLIFQPLPGAEAEARNVAKLLGDDAVLYLGADAREAALEAVHSPRVLHLATHGFYFPDQDFNPLYPAKVNNNWENPLVRCGIALAGANHALQITNTLAEDGLLTGLEASLLDLQGTKLVILSACDSGAGDLKIGEGIMSLRRAFLIAGAQSVLASHWDVSDKATNELMTDFMRRWQSGESRSMAWRDAQLTLLHSKDFSNPYYWAAFTLTGQWQ
jgi:CHAT domain-containing protein